MASLEENIGTDIFHSKDYKLTPTGDVDVITGIANLKNRLFHRLVTSPGGFIHLPDFGVGIKDFQNAPLTLSNQIKLAQRIENQFLQDEDVLEVLGTSFETFDDQPAKTIVKTRVDVRGFEDVTFEFTPFGGSV